MTHYDVLGVDRGASDAEIRSAYLAAARRSHPDVAGADGDHAMRDLNEAWAVLGDAASRNEYDERLARFSGGTGTSAGSGPDRPTINRPVDRPFVPYHPVDEDDDDEWRYVDDVTDPETAPSAVMQLGPMVIVAVGFGLAVVGAVLRTAAIVAFGAVVVVVGFVSFLIVPMLVMSRASSVEHRRAAERTAGSARNRQARRR